MVKKIERIQMTSEAYLKMMNIMSGVVVSPNDEGKRKIFMENRSEIDAVAGFFQLEGTPTDESAKKLRESFLKVYTNAYRALHISGMNVRPGSTGSKYGSPSSMDRYQ